MVRKIWLATAVFTLAFVGCAGAKHQAAPPVVMEDMMNPLCVVLTGENVTDETVSYQGKLYHVCCAECAASFNKDPEKYVRAFEANPAAYGLK